MTPWQWWWLAEGDDEHGDWRGEFGTREMAIADAKRSLPSSLRFYVMEARSSTAMKYEAADCVPFLRTRDRTLIWRTWRATSDSGSRPEDEDSRSEAEREARQSGPKGIAQTDPKSLLNKLDG